MQLSAALHWSNSLLLPTQHLAAPSPSLPCQHTQTETPRWQSGPWKIATTAAGWLITPKSCGSDKQLFITKDSSTCLFTRWTFMVRSGKQWEQQVAQKSSRGSAVPLLWEVLQEGARKEIPVVSMVRLQLPSKASFSEIWKSKRLESYNGTLWFRLEVAEVKSRLEQEPEKGRVGLGASRGLNNEGSKLRQKTRASEARMELGWRNVALVKWKPGCR